MERILSLHMIAILWNRDIFAAAAIEGLIVNNIFNLVLVVSINTMIIVYILWETEREI